MKKTIKLDKAIKLKDTLEKGPSSIKTDFVIINDNNKSTTSKTRDNIVVNLEEILETVKIKSEFLVKLHTKIQEVNNNKLSRSDEPNAFYIKQLQVINSQIMFWGKINTDNQSHFKALEVNDKLRELQKEAYKIEDKIKKFNDSNSVILVIKDEEKKLLEQLGY
jgi:hypothetical protein